MRILRIKQAEAALADGRLDEAAGLLADADVRSHRRGTELVGVLVRRLVERGEGHLAAGRLSEAVGDCEKAIELGGNVPAAAELRQRLAEALADRRRAQRREGDLLAAAREQLDDGRLTAVEALLGATVADNSRAAMLRREAELRRATAEAALRRGRAALERADWAAAIDEVLTARANRAGSDAVAALAADVAAGCLGQARGELLRGRVDLAGSLLRRLAPLGGGGQPAEELLAVIEQCQRAWTYLAAGELRRAGEALRRAASMLPEAKWLAEAVAGADRAAAATEALRAGPLGMLGSVGPAAAPGPGELLAAAGTPAGTAPRVPAESAGPPVLRPAAAGGAGGAGPALPRRFVLRVDGAGSSMVLRDRRVTVGPISSESRPDLGLLADPSLPVITVERSDGDYFLRAEAPVEVNGRPATSRLLAEGDKIALSPQCRLRFRRPNEASGTAVLELSTARLPQADIRRVVLLDRELLLGPEATAHVRAAQMPARAILYVRDGRLLCRGAEVRLGGRALGPDEPLPVGAPVRIGPVGLVVNRT